MYSQNIYQLERSVQKVSVSCLHCNFMYTMSTRYGALHLSVLQNGNFARKNILNVSFQ
jgi:hypothetical protein